MHNVKPAHKYGKGMGVKIGILDWLFGRDIHSGLYTDFIDVTNTADELLNKPEHGYWMAAALKEIAPECSIYAINCCKYQGESQDEADAKRIQYLEAAINWAIESKLDILTYSHPRFTPAHRNKFDCLIDKAAQNGIITTFIHCDNKNNIWPYACMPFYDKDSFIREPDYNILHYDYNHLYIPRYEQYLEALNNSDTINSGDKLPFFSFSSMSPVLGGFVAILKSIRRDLTKDEIRVVLDKTSYEIYDNGEHWYDINKCAKVVDIGQAAHEIFHSKK